MRILNYAGALLTYWPSRTVKALSRVIKFYRRRLAIIVIMGVCKCLSEDIDNQKLKGHSSASSSSSSMAWANRVKTAI